MELAIVVAIMGILTTVAVPKMRAAIVKANESSSKATLSALRFALQLYHSQNDGTYPPDLSPLTSPGNAYMKGDVVLYTGAHGVKSDIEVSTIQDLTIDDGSWGYVNSGEKAGTLWVQCTHTDSRGTAWTVY